jgi:putative transposase
MLRAYRFALDPTPAQARVLASHCGAARKAFNEGLAHVGRCLDQRAAERSYGVPEQQLTEVPWTLPALRRWWNRHKDELAARGEDRVSPVQVAPPCPGVVPVHHRRDPRR